MCDPDADVVQAQRLLALLRDGDLDGAIEAGLMAFDAAARLSHGEEDPVGAAMAAPTDLTEIAAAQRRLRDAWAARDRFRAREARLARRAVERSAKRALAHDAGYEPSALPPAAAAALARAKAKVAGKA